MIRRDFAMTAANVLYDVFFLLIITGFVVTFLNAPGGGVKPCLDFTGFFLAGRLALAGAAAQAYSVATMTGEVAAFCGVRITMPWTYPPPVALLVAPLALLPYGVAYGVFATASYAFYCLVLRRLSASPGHFFVVRLIVAPVVFVTLISGQGSLLVAGLIGWFCLVLLGEASGGGAPLGLLAIKPHLAVGVALLAAARRRWRLLAQAVATSALCALAATLLFGVAIWPAFLGGAAEAKGFLAEGAVYPLFRMVSAHAAAYTLSGSLAVALSAQALVALFCAFVIFRFATRQGDMRVAAGVAALLAAGFSPYAYDYDLATLGVSAALLLPTLAAGATLIEKGALLSLYLFAVLYGFVHSSVALVAAAPSNEPLQAIVRNITTQHLSPGGLAYVGLAVLVVHLLRRAGGLTRPATARG